MYQVSEYYLFIMVDRGCKLNQKLLLLRKRKKEVEKVGNDT